MAGAHFGHLTRRWNPKMKHYIFTSKQGIHIIDLKKTQECVEKACDAISKVAATGETILFVGTKKQAKDIVRTEAQRSGCPYVNERWLGGTLTNFATIRKSVKTLETFEKKASDGTYDLISKKERLTNEKERAKLVKILGGIRNMKKLPGAIFIIDTKKEDIAVSEAHKLGIPVFALIDTNSDPDDANYPIPANDDSFKSIGLITRMVTDAVIEGQKIAGETRPVKIEAPVEEADKKQGPRRPRRGGGRGGRPDGRGGDRSDRGERSDRGDRSGRSDRGGRHEGGPRHDSGPRRDKNNSGGKTQE